MASKKAAAAAAAVGGENEETSKEEEQAPILRTAKHLLQANGSIVGRDVAAAILPHFPTFCSAIPTDLTERPFLGSIDGRVPISHRRARDFIEHDFGPALHALGFGRGDRIALVLPNGPELALAIVATAHWAACVPLSANGATSELEADLQRAGVDLVIGPYAGPIVPPSQGGFPNDERFNVMPKVASSSVDTTNSNSNKNDWDVFSSIQESAQRLNIPFVGLMPSPSESGPFRLVVPPVTSTVESSTTSTTTTPLPALSFDSAQQQLASSKPLRTVPKHNDVDYKLPSGASDEVLVLFTSGTTGNKKLVPHKLGGMLTAATTIALSWALAPIDVNCNLMPLFHVGGIVRQVFSPLLSGSCVVCCPSFDPAIFWALLQQKQAFNWYYAAPTMHQLILQSYDADDASPPPKLRMIANAAGGLLPSLAVQLQTTFGGSVNILPSYGMTECMPISSPPANYQLTKPGTSGVPVGPEVAILNTTTLEAVPVGVEGPICVRGEPLFEGYGTLANDPHGAIPDSFLKDGWFSTGDNGYLDEDGYLFITGRSKEVINRGGEIISPMEVEEQVVSHPDVVSCAAFSTPHNVLQEVVGIALVMADGRPRLDMASLHEHLGERLAAPKWPQCIVFLTGGLPKSHTNKLLRVKLAERFGVPEMTDELAPIQRTFEATCPPQGTALDVAIPAKQVEISASAVQTKLFDLLVGVNANNHREDQQIMVVPHPKRIGALVCHVFNVDRLEAIRVARHSLDRYEVPTHFVKHERRVPSLSTPQELAIMPPTSDAVASILQSMSSTAAGPVDPLVKAVQELFAELLDLDYVPAPNGNFFHMGGSSMLASQLASKVRKLFAVPLSGAEVFHHSTCQEMAELVRQRTKKDSTTGTGASDDDNASAGEKSVDDHGAPFPSEHLGPHTSFLGSLMGNLFQLIPMFIILPVWQASRYLLFFAFLFRSIEHIPGDRDILNFFAAYIAFHLSWIIIMPIVFVAIKWIVIGKYTAGRFPIRGQMYLRWWFVDVCRKLFLRGIWGSNEKLLNFYYRLLGAKIGTGARISLEADIAEFDLVSVGRNAAIEQCTLRPFGVDNGAMILGPVKVGHDASVGARSVVAPYTSIPNGGHLGPVTSSYDVGRALDPKHAKVNRRCIPEPSTLMQVCVGNPITFMANCFGQIPPIMVLLWMLAYKGDRDSFDTIGDLMAWLCDPKRIPFFFGIRVSRAVMSPFFYMFFAICVKKCVIGKFEEGPRNNWSQWQLMRHWLAATLFSRKKIQEVADICGRHYEFVSMLYRMLGAKVGNRVFWPGQQPVFSGEFDLLEIGDDVVFGSRSSIFFSTTDSCEKVTLCAGSNVADNCVVLPGSILGKNAVLGSNSVCPAGWYLPEASVWFGSKGCEPSCLERGAEECDLPVSASIVKRQHLQLLGDLGTIRPFGKAFSMGQASYFLLPLELIVLASVIIKCAVSMFHTLPILASIHGSAAILYGVSIQARDYDDDRFDFMDVYYRVVLVMLVAHMIRVILWLFIELTAKWAIMGRRQVGRYNYDSSNYAQRWEMYQLIAKIRKFNRLSMLDFLSGTPYMTFYFRLNGGNIGKDCCLYPAGADPFMPEPELVTIGDRCVIDCASVVCHLNTRGNFELKTISIENDCTLRTRSRLQQGCVMEQGSQLLEKSLAMTGEIIEAKSVWRGGPASWWFQYSQSTLDYAACP